MTTSGSRPSAVAPKRAAKPRRSSSGSRTSTTAPCSAAIAAALIPTSPAPWMRTAAPSRSMSRAALATAAHAVAVAQPAGASTAAGSASGTRAIAVPARSCTWLAKAPVRSPPSDGDDGRKEAALGQSPTQSRDVGQHGVGPRSAQRRAIVGSGEDPRDEARPRTTAGLDVARGVAGDGHRLHRGCSRAQKGREDEVRCGASAAGIDRGEREVDEPTPSEAVDDRLPRDRREPGGQGDGESGVLQALDRVCRSRDLRDAVLGDDLGVRGLERRRGLPRRHRVTAGEMEEDVELGLPHRLPDVAEGVLPGQPRGDACALGGALERLLHHAVVHDGGAGHVEDDEFDRSGHGVPSRAGVPPRAVVRCRSASPSPQVMPMPVVAASTRAPSSPRSTRNSPGAFAYTPCHRSMTLGAAPSNRASASSRNAVKAASGWNGEGAASVTCESPRMSVPSGSCVYIWLRSRAARSGRSACRRSRRTRACGPSANLPYRMRDQPVSRGAVSGRGKETAARIMSSAQRTTP
ncbi:unnamed protein product [Penicillium discolor]